MERLLPRAWRESAARFKVVLPWTRPFTAIKLERIFARAGQVAVAIAVSVLNVGSALYQSEKPD